MHSATRSFGWQSQILKLQKLILEAYYNFSWTLVLPNFISHMVYILLVSTEILATKSEVMYVGLSVHISMLPCTIVKGATFDSYLTTNRTKLMCASVKWIHMWRLKTEVFSWAFQHWYHILRCKCRHLSEWPVLHKIMSSSSWSIAW